MIGKPNARLGIITTRLTAQKNSSDRRKFDDDDDDWDIDPTEPAEGLFKLFRWIAGGGKERRDKAGQVIGGIIGFLLVAGLVIGLVLLVIVGIVYFLRRTVEKIAERLGFVLGWDAFWVTVGFGLVWAIPFAVVWWFTYATQGGGRDENGAQASDQTVRKRKGVAWVWGWGIAILSLFLFAWTGGNAPSPSQVASSPQSSPDVELQGLPASYAVIGTVQEADYSNNRLIVRLNGAYVPSVGETVYMASDATASYAVMARVTAVSGQQMWLETYATLAGYMIGMQVYRDSSVSGTTTPTIDPATGLPIEPATTRVTLRGFPNQGLEMLATASIQMGPEQVQINVLSLEAQYNRSAQFNPISDPDRFSIDGISLTASKDCAQSCKFLYRVTIPIEMPFKQSGTMRMTAPVAFNIPLSEFEGAESVGIAVDAGGMLFLFVDDIKSSPASSSAPQSSTPTIDPVTGLPVDSAPKERPTETAPPAEAELIPPQIDPMRPLSQPPYPRRSQELGEQGTVILRVYVLTNGNVGQVEIHVSSGYARLDEAALKEARKWTFIPAHRGRVAEAAWLTVPLKFALRN